MNDPKKQVHVYTLVIVSKEPYLPRDLSRFVDIANEFLDGRSCLKLCDERGNMDAAATYCVEEWFDE